MPKHFEVSVACGDGDARHTHTLHISCAIGSFGAAQPPRVRLEYSCPETGEARTAIVRPPVGAAKPFSVARVE
jgi:hypothetical protein